MKLIDRDEWIGWTSRQRAERLGLIVQNRRFLLLTLALSEHESGTPVAITLASKDRGHGRIEHRHVEIFAIEPAACGLPQPAGSRTFAPSSSSPSRSCPPVPEPANKAKSPSVTT